MLRWPLAFAPGATDDEGDAGAFFEQAALVPEAVLAEMPAVIGGEDDDGVVGQVQALERIEHAAGLGVDVADAGQIAADGGAALIGRRGDRVAGNGTVACRQRNVGFVVGWLGWERD